MIKTPQVTIDNLQQAIDWATITSAIRWRKATRFVGDKIYIPGCKPFKIVIVEEK